MKANKVTVDKSQLNQMFAAAVAEALAGVVNHNGRLSERHPQVLADRVGESPSNMPL